MAWTEVHQSIWTHRKTYMLARELNMEPDVAVAKLIRLWHWSLDNAQSGKLGDIPADIIAMAMNYNGDGDDLLRALVRSGWVDQADGDLEIHEWPEYGGRLIEARKRDAERKRRDRRQDPTPPNGTVKDVRETSVPYIAGSPEDVQRTSNGRAPDVRGNSTVQNTTVDNTTVDDVPRTREAAEEDAVAVARILLIVESEDAGDIVLHAMRRNPALDWEYEAKRCKQHYQSWAQWTPGQRALKFSDWLERQTRIEARDAARFQPPQLAVVPSQESAAPSPDDMPGEHDEHPNVPDGTLPKRESDVWDRVQYGVLFQVGWKRWREQRWDLVDAAAWDEERRFLTLVPSPAMRRDRLYDDAMQVTLGGTFMGIRLHGIYWTDAAAAAS